jgi:hypothetical protein
LVHAARHSGRKNNARRYRSPVKTSQHRRHAKFLGALLHISAAGRIGQALLRYITELREARRYPSGYDALLVIQFRLLRCLGGLRSGNVSISRRRSLVVAVSSYAHGIFQTPHRHSTQVFSFRLFSVQTRQVIATKSEQKTEQKTAH